MKRLLFLLFTIAAACGMEAQTLLSREYKLNFYIKYKVFEPEKDTIYYCYFSDISLDEIKDEIMLRFKSKNTMIDALKFIFSKDRQEGYSYLINGSQDVNTLQYQKRGVIIYSGKDELPKSVYIPESMYKSYLKDLGIEYVTIREDRNNKVKDDLYAH